ncbi:MAG TPA: hypothetical protein ENH89_19630 [Aurantimonas coralicida]|uniref:Uncharacterized protein n=1 Tax=Aurantimonas coralicida TaxID=182270 RepID=A0A9C9NIK8_9HYPH|nr:hypothetical protein [Aurantimonas coralicida]
MPTGVLGGTSRAVGVASRYWATSRTSPKGTAIVLGKGSGIGIGIGVGGVGVGGVGGVSVIGWFLRSWAPATEASYRWPLRFPGRAGRVRRGRRSGPTCPR